MKAIVDITVTQVRIYPTDCLPLAELRAAHNVKAIKEAFQFENVQADPLGLQLVFNNGVFRSDGKPIPILSLLMDQRRTQTQVRGRSPVADVFHDALMKLIAPLRGSTDKDGIQPLVKAEETACVATLDINFDELIAPALLHFIQGEAKTRLRTDYGIPRSVAFKNLSFEVKYVPASKDLEEHDIALSSKLLTLEPRMGTPIRERRFYTSSPTDSETHLALLEDLEKSIAGTRREPK